MNNERSSRRDFIGKVIAGATTLSSISNITNSFGEVASHNASVIDAEKKFVPVMITPFTTDLKIDYTTLSKLIDFYRASGVKGFFANCLSSEMYHLQPEERLSLVKHVVKQTKGELPIVATGSFGETMEEKVTFAKKMMDTGVNAVILITGHFAKQEESDEVFKQNMGQFLQRSGGLSFGTYECPSPYKRILTPDTLKFLLDTNRFIYHKDTTLELDKIKEKLVVARGTKLEFYDAHVPNTMYSLQAGARGMSAIAGNFYPEVFAWMCRYVNNPSKAEDVKWLQSELTRMDDIISDGYPISAKYFLQKRGVPVQLVARSSKVVLTSSQKQTLDGIYKDVLGWHERLGLKIKKDS